MRIVRIVAEREAQSGSPEQLDSFETLLGSYRADGHVLGSELMTASLSQRIEAYVFAPAEDAFRAEVRNDWITKRLAASKETGLSEPMFEAVGDDLSEPDGCACASPPSLILFTTYLQVQAPVRCGDCFMPVPLYRLPRFRSNEFQEVNSWSDDYKACDTLFMNSSTGERFGYREMSQVGSSLSQRGRAICTYFEQGTGKAVYYYLHRYYGNSKAIEEARKCPSCGGEWRLSERWHLFDFRCEKCRIVSSLSSSVS